MYQETVISMALIRLELHGSWFPFVAVPWFFSLSQCLDIFTKFSKKISKKC